MNPDEMYSLIQMIISMERREMCEEECECKFFKPVPMCKEGEATYFIDAIQKALGAKDLVILSKMLSEAKK